MLALTDTHNSAFSSLLTLSVLLITTASLQGSVQGQFSQPSEFLFSFLSRAKLLSGEVPPTPPIQNKNLPTITVNVDNWSAYSLVYSTHSINAGVLEKSLPPRNLLSKQRSVALRSMAENKRKKRDKVKGMAGWTLVGAKDGLKVSRMSVAWDLDGKSTKIAISLGDIVPDFGDMWDKTENHMLITRSTFELDKLLRVADSRTTVAAKLTRDETNPNHLKLIVSIIPQNVDVWGWVSYFKEKPADLSTATTATWHKRSQNAGDDRHHQPLPKVVKKSSSGGAGSLASVTVNEGEQDELNSKPLFRRKELLQPGDKMLRLEEEGIANVRDAIRVRASNFSVAVGIQVENWSRFRLAEPSVEIEHGVVLGNLPPGPVGPGKQDISIIGNRRALTGTNGVIRWKIGSESDKVLSVMWSVPYNMQFWSTWVGVGISGTDDLPTYKEMYSNKDDKRYRTEKSGSEFEFSEGNFIVFAFMDGGARSKPVLHLGLGPIKEDDVASSIRKKLGLPVTRKDDENHPKVGQVQKPSSLTNNAQTLKSVGCFCPCRARSLNSCGATILLTFSLLLSLRQSLLPIRE